MAMATTVLMLAAPVALLLIWLNFSALEAYVRVQMGVPDLSSITPESKALAAIVTFGRLAIGMAGLFHLRRMFGEGAAGRPVSALSIRSLRRFSWAALAYAVAAPIERTLVILIFTAGNQQGERMFAFGMGTADAYAIFVGLLFVAVGQMFHEKATDNEEGDEEGDV
jgi:hypothetical protein